MSTLAAEKAALRARVRRLRREAHRPEAGEALAALLPPALTLRGPTAGYWPLGAEIDPRPLLGRLCALGVPVLLPRAPGREAALEFLPWRPGVRLSPDAFGVPAPVEGAAQDPAVIFMPLLGFDRSGGRLGQGGGHYDRVLARLKPQGALAVGLAFAVQELAAVPREAHDQTLDWVLTEREAIRCG